MIGGKKKVAIIIGSVVLVLAAAGLLYFIGHKIHGLTVRRTGELERNRREHLLSFTHAQVTHWARQERSPASSTRTYCKSRHNSTKEP